MNTILPIYKPVGLTPLQLINQLRLEKPAYQDVKIGYAGRLDPMAHGIMLLMIGDETKNRDQYLSLAKEYTFTALLGMETDTYDVLGIVKTIFTTPPTNVNIIVNKFVNDKMGKQLQKYPPFSSKAVAGKPLFAWAKEGKLDQIEIPNHEIEIISLKQLSTKTLEKNDLQKQILEKIMLVQGDFRQAESIEQWKNFFVENDNQTYTLLTFSMHCTSGTYVRQLVHELGRELGCGAITFDILRTKLGKYTIEDALHLTAK